MTSPLIYRGRVISHDEQGVLIADKRWNSRIPVGTEVQITVGRRSPYWSLIDEEVES